MIENLCLISIHFTVFILGDVVPRAHDSVSPEPKLIALNKNDTIRNNSDNKGVEEKKTDKTINRTESEKREKLIIDQLNKMKFTTPLDFDLD